MFDIHFNQDFEDNTPGIYKFNEWQSDWNYPWEGSYLEKESTVYIIENTDPEQGSKVMRFLLPAGSYAGSGIPAGGGWETLLNKSPEELYFSYRIKFNPGFEWVHGGKIPGIRGGPVWDGWYGPPYDGGFVNFLMWSEQPTIAHYYYYHGQTHQYGATSLWDTRIESGKWYTVTLRTVMNSINGDYGNTDAIFEGYIDGKLVSQITGFTLRNLTSIGIDRLNITSFFGGAEPLFAAARDEWIELDDFVAFTYKPEIDVPRGNELSPPDRVLLLPNEVYNDSVWRVSLTANALSSKTIELEWKSYFYPVTYTIQRKAVEGTVFEDIATISYPQKIFQNGGLVPNTAYTYRIKTGNSVTNEFTLSTLPPSIPVAPVSLRSLLTGTTSVRLAWNDNSNNELGFIIERSDGTAENFRQIATVKANIKEYTNSSLTPKTTYFYRVKAYNEDGHSSYSNVLTVTTLALQLPAAPDGLNATDVTKNSFTIAWNDNSNNETGFQIYKLVDSTGSYKLFKTIAANTRQLAVTGLQPNTAHTFRVRAYNDDGASGYTNIIKVSTLPLQPPIAPLTLKSDSIAPSAVKLSWQDRSSNETGFYIYRSLAATSGFQQIHTSGRNQNTFLNSGLDQGKTYYYRVRAYNADGLSAYTNTLKVTTLNPPGSPTALLLKNLSKTSATIEWSDNTTNESGFYIERSLNNPGLFVRIDTLKADSTLYINTSLKSNTVYFYRIIAFNNDGLSLPSDTLRIQTEPLIIPSAPSNLVLEYISPFSAEIKWDDNSPNENGFQLQRADSTMVFANLKNLLSGIATYNDTTLADDAVYYYRIRAYNNDGYSKFSDTLMVRTPANIIPQVPRNFKTALVKFNQTVMSWEAFSDQVIGFEIERESANSGQFALLKKTGFVLSYTDTTVKEGESYAYRIRAFNEFNFSGYTPFITAEIPFLVLPEPPELLTPEAIESNSITLKWKYRSADESGFIVKRAVYPQDKFEALHTASTNDTLYTDNTVSPNTTYFYIVNAINENGLSDNSNKLRVSSMSLAEKARWHDGLIAYYNFSLNSDSIIHDLSGIEEPVDLFINDTTNVSWQNNSRLEITNATCIKSLKPAKKIVKACKETNEITIECWIKPSASDFSGESCIISLSEDEGNIGFSLM
ncbi:MAG: fibronectin type III domain-containing protein, partial [Bacteroidales bacterium]